MYTVTKDGKTFEQLDSEIKSKTFKRIFATKLS